MKDANAQTLFHLVPRNGLAEDSLRHPDNRHFVSNSLEGKSGLEIGFHVPAIAGGRIITRLGKNTDLILRGTGLSTVHVAFEMHPVTHVVLLSVRSRAVSSVETTHQPKDNPRPTTAIKIEGDCVIEYGESYLIAIALQEFKLVWSWHGKPDRLKELALQGYSNSLKRLEDVNSRYHPSDVDHSQYQSWYMTRIHSTNKLLVDEVGGTRVKIGGGAFGTVYKAIDSRSGNYFAVKEVDLSTERNRDVVRSHLHREIKALERLSHDNIIKLLGAKDWHTDNPLIFMPLMAGSLTALCQPAIAGAKNMSISEEERRAASSRVDDICRQMTEQMLCALDYLAFHQLCHRDVKPENILHDSSKDGQQYHFQLADFGFINHDRSATTYCGTGLYMAPELYLTHGNYRQSPKMDVWSLFVSVLVLRPAISFPPEGYHSHLDVQRAVEGHAREDSSLAAMARINPTHRASAAQMLVALFGGRGLTTPGRNVPPIGPGEEDVAATPIPSAAPPAPPAVIAYPRQPWHQYRQRTTRRLAVAAVAGPSRPTAPRMPWAPPATTRPTAGGAATAAQAPQPIRTYALADGVPKQRRATVSKGKGPAQLDDGLRLPGRYPE